MKLMDPRKQFSKWLAKYGAIAWGVFLGLLIVVIIVRPETSMACVYMLLIVTVNKALDTLSYTDNSKTEKILLAGLERARIEIGWKGSMISGTGVSRKEEKEETTNEEVLKTEEESNG